MARPTDQERKAAIQQKIAKMQQELRHLSKREKTATEKARVHAAIVVGADMIEHAFRNPGSEVQRVAIRICENWLKTRSEDQAVAALLAQLQASPPAADTPEAAE